MKLSGKNYKKTQLTSIELESQISEVNKMKSDLKGKELELLNHERRINQRLEAERNSIQNQLSPKSKLEVIRDESPPFSQTHHAKASREERATKVNQAAPQNLSQKSFNDDYN